MTRRHFCTTAIGATVGLGASSMLPLSRVVATAATLWLKRPEGRPLLKSPHVVSNEEILAREYLPSIRRFPEETQDWLIEWSTHTLVRTPYPNREPGGGRIPVSNDLPKELDFLGGSDFADLGFGKLDLPKDEITNIYLAFCGRGVAIPGTVYKLRHSVMSLFTYVEPAAGDEVTLPDNWRQTVRSSRWVGKKVDASVLNVDLSMYDDMGDGYLLRRGGSTYDS